jgi:hypothetical protein
VYNVHNASAVFQQRIYKTVIKYEFVFVLKGKSYYSNRLW